MASVARARSYLAFAALALAGVGAAAHGVGPSSGPARGLAWTFEPWEVASLALGAVLYGVGLGRLWRRAGVGHGVRVGQAVAYFAGLLAIVAALMSPLDALGDALSRPTWSSTSC